MTITAAVPKDHPLMLAWEAHKQSDEYANSKKWAAHAQHVDGSLWALFEAGWRAAHISQPAQAEGRRDIATAKRNAYIVGYKQGCNDQAGFCIDPDELEDDANRSADHDGFTIPAHPAPDKGA